ncbi:hypothetical protein [Ruegeria arenilitoris]|uniref:hypothetical protein n=2 Tax=Ruegeria TaxID=97050 RepID=UPI0020C4C4AA|nr:hypothetical protein [Ruegeria arenilitoris]
MVEILKREIPHPRVRTNRMDSDMTRNRIVEWTRDEAGKVHMKLYRKKSSRSFCKNRVIDPAA